MINLMYIVLTAMLALNVSSDVLNGFTQVEEGLTRTNDNVEQRNAAILGTLRDFAEKNPDKGQRWYDKAAEVRGVTEAICVEIDSIKGLIVKEADGDDGDVRDIQNRDNLEAASVVMLSGGNPLGRRLRANVEGYREYVSSLMTDSVNIVIVLKALCTEAVKR